VRSASASLTIVAAVGSGMVTQQSPELDDKESIQQEDQLNSEDDDSDYDKDPEE
jgi:hypothetical protein